MDEQSLADINWRRPTKDDLRTLYVSYMDLMTLGVVICREAGVTPSPYMVDDARTTICHVTGMSRDQYNRLIERALKILTKEGVPEVFVTDLAQETEHDMDDLYDDLEDLYDRFMDEQAYIQTEFNAIVANLKGIN